MWGVQINASTEKMSLPETRVLKGAYLLAEPQFNYGERSLTLKDVQRFRGIATGWATVVKGLRNELKAADRFLGGVDGGARISPSRCSTEAEEEMAWADLWDIFEDCRWLCSRSETWAEKFGGDIREALGPWKGLRCRTNTSPRRSSYLQMLRPRLWDPLTGPTVWQAGRTWRSSNHGFQGF